MKKELDVEKITKEVLVLLKGMSYRQAKYTLEESLSKINDYAIVSKQKSKKRNSDDEYIISPGSILFPDGILKK